MKICELNGQTALMKREILARLDIIDAKVSALPQVHVQVSSHLLPTLNALNSLGRPAIATEIAQITGRARAHESMILNNLWASGLVTKKQQQRNKVFKVKQCQPKT